jgi:hypothetical protein
MTEGPFSVFFVLPPLPSSFDRLPSRDPPTRVRATMNLTRRRFFELAAAAGLASVASSFAPAGPAGAGPAVLPLASYRPRAAAMRDALRARVSRWVRDGHLARGDGFVYTVEVAQLMQASADARDRDGYAALRDHAVRHLVSDDRSSPYTRGFVPWRYKPGVAPDASGTTEALRLARALWTGAAAFGAAEDRAVALKVLDGYRRHVGEESGVWLVRNYFNFQTRAFATNSFLVDYDADFVAEVAAATGDADLKDLAARSYDVVRKSATPSGLLRDVIQPELRTIYPHREDVIFFSPNDVIQISNSATVACTVARGAADVAAGVFGFALARLPALALYYRGETGEVVRGGGGPGVCEYSGLARLGMLLNRPDDAARFVALALGTWEKMLEDQSINAYAASEALAAMGEVCKEN